MTAKNKYSKIFLLATLILVDLLSAAELDLFVPSFPEIRQHFDLTPFWVEALLSVNFIGYCTSLFVVGTLSDKYGRKPLIMLGLSIFIVGSIICVTANEFEGLLVGRFLQGLGIAAPSILCFLVIADEYPLKEQQSLFAILNGIMNATLGIAPVVGSYITLYFHWHGNFMALLLFGIVCLVAAQLFIPSRKIEHNENFTSAGYRSILKSWPVMLITIHIVMMCIPYWIFVGMSPILYMEDLGVSLHHFGFYQGILAFLFAIGSIAFGFVVKKFEQKSQLNFTNLIFVLSLIAIFYVTWVDSKNPLLLTLAILIFVFGQIIPSVILYPLCLSLMPQSKARISAIMQGFRLVLTAISLQVAGYFYQGSFQNIGIIILVFVVLSIYTLNLVVNNKKIERVFYEQ